MTSLVCEEVLRPHMVSEHDIIIEVNKVWCQTRDTVKVTLNGRGTIRGEVGTVRKDLFMRHQGDTRGVQVEPGWDLPIGDDEDLANPRCKLLH